MKRVMGLVLSLAFLSAPSLASSPVDGLSEAPRNWSAPPYWTPAPPAGDESGRTAIAAGRQSLVTTPSPLPFVALPPCRAIDTRAGSGFPAGYGQPSIAPGAPRTFVIIGQCGIPADTKAVSFNFAVWIPSTRGDLRVFPAGGTVPVVSTLNWEAGILALANAAVVPLGAGGDIAVLVDGPGTVDLFVDINGYYSPLGVVNSLNGQAGDINLIAGSNVSITPLNNTLTIASFPPVAGGPPTGPAGGALTGTYPNPGLAGAFAGLAANAFTGTQTIGGGNLALPATTGIAAGVLTLGGFSFLHAFGGPTNTFAGAAAGGGFATTGVNNSAFGVNGLFFNTTGSNNAAFGVQSLGTNTTGSGNAAFGFASLLSNTTGSGNAAFGEDSLHSNEIGVNNVAFGNQSLFSTTGDFNIAIGFDAGVNLTTGSSNIDIGSDGVAAEANTIRIGNGAQTRAFISGISGATTALAALPVVIDGNGQLGTASSTPPLPVVNSLNALAGAVTLAAGANVSITPLNNTLTIAAVAGGAPSGPAGGALTGTYPNPGLAGTFASLGANTFAGTQTIGGGNLALPATTGFAAGVLTLGGFSFLHAFGGPTNTFVGAAAGAAFFTTGSDNSAFGTDALFSDTTGSDNAAFGFQSLLGNTTGGANTAFGSGSLLGNTVGVQNAAFGFQSLFSNTAGIVNAAFGGDTLRFNTTGGSNVAVGNSSLLFNTTGSFNIAIGAGSGENLTTGDNNVDIGHHGVAAESNTTRIGTAGLQTRTFISGVSGVTTALAATAVVVDGNGQFGTISSSRRYKDDIADMDAASSALMALRPVTFHYKTDQRPSGRTLQYGLIAEEVAEVYPGLVARSAGGQIETVLYQFLPPMLLNEYQKQQRTIEAQAAEIEAQREQIDRLTARLLEGEAVTTRLDARLAQAEARLAQTR